MSAFDSGRTWLRRERARRLARRADAARDARRWETAAAGYSASLRMDATRAPIHVQHGHMLKEAGDREGACRAYDRALAIDPDDWDAWVQRGHVLKLLGRPEEAVAAYSRASALAPAAASPRAELIALGARDAIPDAAEVAAIDAAAVAAREAARTLDRTVREARELSNWPSRAFDDFRRAYPILPPPPDPAAVEAAPIAVIVDGRGMLAAQVRCTLDGLLDQSCPDWTATVLVNDAIAGHPVASIAAIDRRIAFVTEPAWTYPKSGSLRLRAGMLIDARAIEWFRFAIALCAPAAAYCDHDHAEQDWRGYKRHFDPVLQPRFDPFWFETGRSAPALIYVAGEWVNTAGRDDNNGRVLCAIAAAGGRITHIPRLLATVVAAGAATAPPDPAPPVAPSVPPRRIEAMIPDQIARIVAVIPTRDQPALLERSVTTLAELAHRPDRLEIVIVDNRSLEVGTASLLTRLTATHGVRVMPLDEPFNWPRANNLAVRSSDAPILLFLNNDTEMLTRGWDDILAEHLSRPEVGIVGARLLYPSRTVQHAGILFGMNDAPPAHEAVGAAEDDPGPDGRWVRPRSAAAVTGAFMAMRRDTWLTAGGFDELAFPVGYNDVDMCMKVRAAGKRVLYAPDLLLIHYESVTRGHNVTRSQVAWDLAELRALHARWGSALFDDPSLNPHWNVHGAAFRGYREPTPREIVRHMVGDPDFRPDSERSQASALA